MQCEDFPMMITLLQVANLASRVAQIILGVATVKTRPAIMLGMLALEAAKRAGK